APWGGPGGGGGGPARRLPTVRRLDRALTRARDLLAGVADGGSCLPVLARAGRGRTLGAGDSGAFGFVLSAGKGERTYRRQHGDQGESIPRHTGPSFAAPDM